MAHFSFEYPAGTEVNDDTIGLVAKLQSRAETSLLNQAELTPPEALETAASETMELTENKPIPTTMLLDLAMLRLNAPAQGGANRASDTTATQAIKSWFL